MKKIFLSLCLVVCAAASAQERIIEFKSTVVVNTDRSVDVTEEIKVDVRGIDIKRGIFRDVITTMQNENDKRLNLSLTVSDVLKNGVSENFVTEPNGIYTRIKTGSADVLLNPGVYTYTIKYNLNRQVRFFDTYDEVYWNATGNDWAFEIEKASVKIILPADATILQHAGYTGESGATGCSCQATSESDYVVRYATTGRLHPYEGLTVAVGWQKGIISPPTTAEEEAEEEEPSGNYFGSYDIEYIKESLAENNAIYYGAIGLLGTFLYLMLAWFSVGRDPKKGTIIPRYVPPDGYSPAACRYVIRMNYDTKTFTASIVSMAIKGFLVIDKTGKHFQLKKVSDDNSMLSAGEKKAAKCIFHETKSVTLDSSYDPWLAKAVNELNKQLRADFRRINFNKNYVWMVPAIFMGIATIFLMMRELLTEAIFLHVAVIGFLTLFVSPFVWTGVTTFINGNWVDKLLAFIPIVVPIAIISIPIYFIVDFTEDNMGLIILTLPYLGILFGVIFLCGYFFRLMQAPTVMGRKRMDEIEGLKMFMEVAEKNRLNMLNPPEKTPQLFEKLLPYAIALDVENAWGKQFDSIIDRAIENNEYSPSWYSGTTVFHAHQISSSLASSFSSSLQSSSTPPSSSDSGSSGGGSSGGGGGGGGGGGW